jgi:hypothetical protein
MKFCINLYLVLNRYIASSMLMLQDTVRYRTVSFLTSTFGKHYFLVPLTRFGPWASMRGHKWMDGWMDIDGQLVNIRTECDWLRKFTTSFGIWLFFVRQTCTYFKYRNLSHCYAGIRGRSHWEIQTQIHQSIAMCLIIVIVWRTLFISHANDIVMPGTRTAPYSSIQYNADMLTHVWILVLQCRHA